MTTKAQGRNWSADGSSDTQKFLLISNFFSRNKADVSRAEQTSQENAGLAHVRLTKRKLLNFNTE